MGVVFDTTKFNDYSKFAGLDLEKQKAREDVETDKEKKNPWDFLLWVTGNPKHIMKWESPWGEGYPGWHIECTAMSTKYLGENFDIHTGGVEHIGVHHTNEVAQGYAAFGKQTANYWLHNAWLTGKAGVKMSKSLGNYLTVQDLQEKGYDPMALRYLILGSHYKKGLNFSLKALDSAQTTLKNLYQLLSQYKDDRKRTALSDEKAQKVDGYRKDFIGALSDDINTPKALSVLWEMLKSNIPSEDKYDLAIVFDEVLGLKFAENVMSKDTKIPKEITDLLEKREALRKDKKFEESDMIRKEIEEKGYKIDDTPNGAKIIEK
jgi:cysteinyl-tRNA synthetase